MKQYEPYIVAIYQSHNDLTGALKPWKRREPFCTEVASDSEADRIPQEAAGPYYGD